MRALRATTAAFLFAGVLSAQTVEYVKANYTKYEYLVPMRDGKKLFTSVYVPKDESERWPIMLTRTPYGVSPYGIDVYRNNLGPSSRFAEDRYIFVYQDVRGRNLSEGDFQNMRPMLDEKRGPHDIDEASDTYDTIDWLVKNIPGNNGRVGMWGISYPGFYTAAGLIDAHPALKCASPQAPISDWFMGDDFHHNGALYLPHTFRFFNTFGRPRPEPVIQSDNNPAEPNWIDAYTFFLRLGPLSNVNEKYYKNDVAFWNEMVKHPNYDEFWKARNLRPHLKNIKPAVMTVGGWFDAEDLFGALNVYKSVEEQSPGSSNILVMGPWFHGGWARSDGEALGNVHFGSKTSEYYQTNIEFPFFRYYLKGKGAASLPEAYVFETGRNVWHREDAWPPKTVRPASLYLRTGGKLSFQPPDDETAFDEYISDPDKPVPYVTSQAAGMTREHMTEDQRFAAARPDVLVYQTDPLTADVTIAGPLRPCLFVSTTGTDSDFVVKLIDVYPDDFPDNDPNPGNIRMGGYQQLLRGELMRGRFRNSYGKPEPFTPGKVEKVEYVMPDVYHTFRQGHRIMIQVQSSWFPLADRNPQKFVDIYSAKAADFQKATERVYHSRAASSRLMVNVKPNTSSASAPAASDHPRTVVQLVKETPNSELARTPSVVTGSPLRLGPIKPVASRSESCPSPLALDLLRHEIAYQKTEELEPLKGLEEIHADVWERGHLTAFYVHERLKDFVPAVRMVYEVARREIRGAYTCPAQQDWKECIERNAGTEAADYLPRTCTVTVDIRTIPAWKPSPSNPMKQRIADELRNEIEAKWQGVQEIIIRDFNLKDNQITMYLRMPDGDYYQGCGFRAISQPHCEGWHLFGQAPVSHIRKWILEKPYRLK